MWKLKRRAITCALGCMVVAPTAALATDPPHSADLDAMIIKEAKIHGIPERLVRRVVMRESRYNPRARNHKYWGLMQISYPTARSMGFRGTPEELLNPVTNLTYAVPYLANAFIAAGKREDAAVRLYASGYYDTARRHGLLGLMRTAASTPLQGFHEDVAAAPEPTPSSGIFGALFGAPDPAPTLAQQPAPQIVAEAIPTTPAASPPGVVPPSSTRSPVAARGSAPTTSAGSASAPGDTDMIADSSGRFGPPKRWRHDGGYTVIARGEQVDTHSAGSAEAQETTSRHRMAHRTHKITEFASVEVPAAAQAYASTAGQTAPPQAAIEQAVAAPQQAGLQTAPAASPDAAAAPNSQGVQAIASVPAPADASASVSSKSGRRHHTSRTSVAHAHGAVHRTAVAKAATPSDVSAGGSGITAKAIADLK